MAEEKLQPSKARRILQAATKLTIFLVIVGLGIQTGTAFFEQSGPSTGTEETSTPESDLGAWTFAGEGLSVAVRTIEVADMESELLGSGDAGSVDPSIPKGDAEKQILELLATQPPTKKGAGGRRGWRQTVSGIAVYAETCKTAEGDRLAVARAAWSTSGEGLTLLEIRPNADAKSNGTTVDRPFPTPEGATEMARRVTTKGVVTGTLMTSKGSLETVGKAINESLARGGWSVSPVEVGEETSAQPMACRRGDEKLQVVVFRNESVADQTMIMCIRD